VKQEIHIVIIETSAVVYEGLATVFSKSTERHQITIISSLDELEQLCMKKKANIVIINPSLLQNNLKTFHTLKTQLDETKWLAFIYAHYDPQLLSLFDGTLTISDNPSSIIATVNKVINENSTKQEQLLDVLSDRETDVLKLLATGSANKEIADKLNISINTVITHRKNISQKTGIKSVSGLTIYAVLKKLITIEHIQE
jgi:DNA-binding NarL/FixJ family response regulator